MRFLFGLVAAAVVLVVFTPIVCMSGSDEPGYCSSVVGLRMPGNAENGDIWTVVIPLAALLLFLVVWGPRRR